MSNDYQQIPKNQVKEDYQKSETTESLSPQPQHHSNIVQRAVRHPKLLTRQNVMQLQSTMGNQAVVQLLKNSEKKSTFSQKKGNLLPEKHHNESSKNKNRSGLPGDLKLGIENLSGISMDDVKVHYNSNKPAEIGAEAYAKGSEIHVKSGQEKHLPHEAWHVVQQKKRRVQPTGLMKGFAVNNDNQLEKEADVMGAKAREQAHHNFSPPSTVNEHINSAPYCQIVAAVNLK